MKTMIKGVVGALWLLSAAVDAAKVKRVKAGMQYKKHDPVELVVNKVG
jgi:hypothetical protein